jgi:glycolate oxidase
VFLKDIVMVISKTTFAKLQSIVGTDHCTCKKEDLACYAYDATARMHLPDAVIFPENARQISSILKLANADNFFVIPRGAGSGMTGGAIPVKGGVVLVTSRMNHIISIDTDNLIADVQPGVITGHFHAAVEKEGLFYPPDPASSDFSTLGGNVAECAGGPGAVKYGVTRDYVLGLEAVLPTGEIIHTGVRTAKGVVGYDLTRLIIGSEGTLAVISAMTLKLLPLPEAVGTLTASFKHMENAAETVSEIIRRAIIPRNIEFMDNASIQSVESQLNIGLPVSADALLIMAVDGSRSEVTAGMEKLQAICEEMGAMEIRVARNPQEAKNLWRARKAISPSLFKFGPDKINEDIVVPRSKIPDMVRRIKALRDETGLTIVAFGHAGDGNIHFNIMLDKRNPEVLKTAEQTIETLFDYTLQLGGTISGEHGVGLTKMQFIKKEIGPAELILMKKIKNVFDPNGILNPGKIFPA